MSEHKRALVFTSFANQDTTVEAMDSLGYDEGIYATTEMYAYVNREHDDDPENGNLYISGAFISPIYENLSDRRLKSNIHDIDCSDSMYLMDLKPKSYVFNSKPNKLQRGFIAQEINEIKPDIVRENVDGYLCVEYTQFIPDMINLIQNLNHRCNILENEMKKSSCFVTVIGMIFNIGLSVIKNCIIFCNYWTRHFISTLYVQMKTGKEV